MAISRLPRIDSPEISERWSEPVLEVEIQSGHLTGDFENAEDHDDSGSNRDSG